MDEIRQRVDQRLAELEPMLTEYRELIAVKEGLDAQTGSDAARRTSTARPRRGGRRSGGGETRADQAHRLIKATPGITVKEIAQEMKINDNYLYRLLPRMEKEGRLRREGKGWAIAD